MKTAIIKPHNSAVKKKITSHCRYVVGMRKSYKVAYYLLNNITAWSPGCSALTRDLLLSGVWEKSAHRFSMASSKARSSLYCTGGTLWWCFLHPERQRQAEGEVPSGSRAMRENVAEQNRICSDKNLCSNTYLAAWLCEHSTSSLTLFPHLLNWS